MIIIALNFEGGIDLEPDQVWPDGDIPEEITAEKVAEVLLKERSLARLIESWELRDVVSVYVTIIDADGPRTAMEVTFG